MSDRVRELAEHQAGLQLRCAAQRRGVARDIHGIEARLRSIDRVAAVTRGALHNPVVIVGGVVALLVLGRTRTFHLIGRGLLLASAARRLLRVAKKL